MTNNTTTMRQVFSEDEKKAAVRKFRFEGKAATVIAKEIGLKNVYAIYKWSNKYPILRRTKKMMEALKKTEIHQKKSSVGELEGVIAMRQKHPERFPDKFTELSVSEPETMHEPGMFMTKSIALAAYFMLKGYEVKGTKASEIEPWKKLFLFEASKDLIEDSKKYFSGEAEGSLRDFYAKTIDAKKILFGYDSHVS